MSTPGVSPAAHTGEIGTVRPSAPQAVAGALTAIFVPGDRPERFVKAATSGADVVVIDLEDAVAKGDKQQALEHVVRALSPGGNDGLNAVVRTNGLATTWFEAEVEALVEIASAAGHGVLGLMLPKAEDATAVAAIGQRLPDNFAFVPLIESAVGIVNAVEIARVPEVNRLAFGAVDFALDIDVGADSPTVDRARSMVVLASRAAGIAAPLDAPSTAIRDLEHVATYAARGRSLGFGGSLCIHPVQVALVRDAHLPTQKEIQWAQKIMAVADAGASQVDGAMIDRPVIDHARRVIARSGKVKT
ncbi:HpcH/HpaI aldolase/citrate lyase family protein [Nesterenkonia haasae]|uniref:HpcH/HpaI aldolase/citrate lyase family protein n=1 Tax=Nesterenkonia haasae TaxID=2587813 RepID=UPI001391C628|nr:CoA ester lyase [Nesterenkonia haasae]NDK32340.1 CoA ester lyase [Nesterenkonia haasae]